MKDISSKARRVLLAAIGINVLNGMLYTWSSFSLYMINNWGWTSKQASLPYTVHTVFSVTAMVIFGSIQDRKGPRIIAMAGSISLGLGLILAGLTESFIGFLIFIGVLVGCGIGMQTVTTTTTAVRWFSKEQKGFISGLVSSGVAISSIIYAILGNYLLENYGLGKTLIYMGIVIVTTTTLLASILDIPRKEEKKLDQENIREDMETSVPILTDKNFYKIWLMRAFTDSAGLMIISHISVIAKVQANWNKGFILIILVSVFNTFGRIIGGHISDRIGRNRLIKYILILQGINLALFSGYRTALTMAIGVAIAGFSYGTGFGIFPAYISDLYGEKNLSFNYGLLFTAWSLGGTIGPMAAASIFDARGSYSMAYGLELVLLIMALGLSFTIKEGKDYKVKEK